MKKVTHEAQQSAEYWCELSSQQFYLKHFFAVKFLDVSSLLARGRKSADTKSRSFKLLLTENIFSA